MLGARAVWRGVGLGKWTLGAIYMQTYWKYSVECYSCKKFTLRASSWEHRGVILGFHRSLTWNKPMDSLEHLLMPSALFLWHIRIPMVVAGSGKTLSGGWCGRVRADLPVLHSPWRVVEDMTFPTFPSHLGSGVAVVGMGKFQSQFHWAEGPWGHSITHPVCTQTRMNIFGLLFLTTHSQSSGTDLSGCETQFLSELCCLLCCLLLFILLPDLWERVK